MVGISSLGVPERHRVSFASIGPVASVAPRRFPAAAYILGTNLTGLAAVWAGLRLFGRAV
jgi:hypothetical protein